MAEPGTKASPPPKGGKILGMPRQVAIYGGVALAAGLVYIWWRNRQPAASTAAGATTGTTAPGDKTTITTSTTTTGTLGTSGHGAQRINLYDLARTILERRGVRHPTAAQIWAERKRILDIGRPAARRPKPKPKPDHDRRDRKTKVRK